MVYKSSRMFIFCLIYFLLVKSVSAQLLINPDGGTVLFNDSGLNDGIAVRRSLGFTGSFFNVNTETIDVSTKGNLNMATDVSGYNASMPDWSFGVARISPLWDDLQLYMNSGSRVVENKQEGVYYSVTWRDIQTNTESTERQTFQVVWFGSATTVAGLSFSTNDIAFAYERVDADFADSVGDEGATVGLDKGDGITYSPLPGTPLENGVVTDDTKYLLPVNNGQFVLFKPDGNGSYSVAVVPSPSSLLTTFLGGTLLWLKQLFNSRRSKTSSR